MRLEKKSFFSSLNIPDENKISWRKVKPFSEKEISFTFSSFMTEAVIVAEQINGLVSI